MSVKLTDRLGFMGFERENQQPIHLGWVSEFGTHIWPLELSDQVAADQTQAGWLGWAGHLNTPTFTEVNFFS